MVLICVLPQVAFVGEGEGVHKSDKIHAHTIMMHSVQALYCN